MFFLAQQSAKTKGRHVYDYYVNYSRQVPHRRGHGASAARANRLLELPGQGLRWLSGFIKRVIK